MTRFVNHLESNLKRGFEGELAPCTLVVGKNASGKTSIAASLELALTGRIEGVGALGAELLALAASSPLRVTAKLSDGSSASAEVSGTTAKASKVKRLGPEGVMLWPLVRDILTAEPKRQRAALLRACTSDLDVAALAADALPTAFVGEWKTLWSATQGDSDADRLVNLLELLRARLREYKRIVAPQTVQVEAPSEDEIAQARAGLDTAEAVARLDSLRTELARLTPQLQTAMVGPAPAGEIREAVAALRGLVAALEYAAVRSMRCCFACEAEADSARLLAAAQARLRRGEAALARISEVAPGLGERVAYLRDEIARIEKLPSAFSAEHAKRIYDAVMERHGAAVNAAREKKAYLAAAKEIDALTALEKAANRMVEAALANRISLFETRASKLAPVAVQLFDGGKSVCRVGLQRESQIIPWRALSGAERALLTAGVAAGIGASDASKLRVVVVDDVWLDANSLVSLCAGLGRAVAEGYVDQAIVCAVEAPEVAGWTRVEVA